MPLDDQRRKLLVLFFASIFLVSPYFLPNLSDISAHDETLYVNQGRLLVDFGILPRLAGNPLVSLFYALTYLPFRGSPHWLVQSDSLARVILYSLLWLSGILVAWRMKRFAPPGIAGGLLLVTPLATNMLAFPSDPLFAALAGLAFWGLLGYHDTRQVKNLFLASSFVGLASFSRNDGLLLFPIFLFLAGLLSWRERSWRHIGKSMLAAGLPFLVLVGGYVLGYGLHSGNYSLGTLERSYESFEFGQEEVLSPSGTLNATVEARQEAQRYFGTAEENDNSILKAIRRNPAMYLSRLKAALLGLPNRLLRAYGLNFTVLLVLFSLRGVIELARQRQYLLIACFLLWSLHLASALFTTLIRIGYLQFPYYLVFSLAAVGLFAVMNSLAKRREALFWLGVGLILMVYGLIGNKLAIYYGAAVILGAFLVIYFYLRKAQSQPADLTPALLFLFLAGLILHGSFPSPKIRSLGSEPPEQAVLFLSETYPTGTSIAAGAPGAVIAARMSFSNLTSPDVPFDRTPQAFVEWLHSQGIRLVYVDRYLYADSPRLWELLQAEIGVGLERVFSADEGNIQILEIK